jgi:hypothetical protein
MEDVDEVSATAGSMVNENDRFRVTTIAAVVLDFGPDGKNLEIQFGFGLDTSPLPAQGAEIPEALLEFGNFMREKKIDGSMWARC